jgi:hypothetical protein
MGKYHGYRIRRLEDIELLLPTRMQLELKPSDNPLHRPYPEHAKDLAILKELLSDLNAEPIRHEFVEKDSRVSIRPHGVLFIHALDIQNLILSKHSQFTIYTSMNAINF